MIKQRTSSEAGFTLTEFVMVMAIGGLMLAGVLVAVLTATQIRNDNKRKAAAATIQKNLQIWASNNRGIIPTTATSRADFTNTYTDDLIDPGSGNNFTVDWSYRYTEDASGNHSGAGGVVRELNAGEMAVLAPSGSRTRKAIVCVGTQLGGMYCTDTAIAPGVALGAEESLPTPGTRPTQYVYICQDNANPGIITYAATGATCPTGTTARGASSIPVNNTIFATPCYFISGNKGRYVYAFDAGSCPTGTAAN